MGLIFDGVDLELTYGVVVSGAGSWAKPERDRELVHVPGRNGDLIYDNGCWLNVEIPYSLYFRDGWLYKYSEFCEWLCSHVGYFRLEDPDRHPGVYRMAEFAGQLDPKKWLLTDDGIVTITFNCKPQQWLLDGEIANVVPFTQIVNGYYDANGDWVDSDGTLGISTVLYESDNYLYPDFSATVRNNSTAAKAVVVGKGSYDSNLNFLYSGSWSTTIQPGGIYSLSATTDPELAFTSVSVYCANGLEGLSVSISGSDVDADINLADPLGGVYNPTPYSSTPLITVAVDPYDQTDYTLVINDFEMLVQGVPTGATDVRIDCDLEDCYFVENGVLVNANQYVSISNSNPKELKDFPYLTPGKNRVLAIGNKVAKANSSNFTVTPRWYKI